MTMPADAARLRLTVPSGADQTGAGGSSGGPSSSNTGVGGGSGVGGVGSGSSTTPSKTTSVGGNTSSLHTPSSAYHHHPHHGGHHHGTLSSSSISRPTQYILRLFDIRQMDVQSALDQMKTLLSTRPHVVYKTSYYRKQTKNHWARDDPAFVAIQILFLSISSIAYSISFRVSIPGGIAFLLYSILFNWFGSGFIIATLGREIANRHLTVHQSSSHVRQSVEWLYAFDIHCNAFFPVFVVLYGVQFFLLPLVLGKSLIALIVSNTIYAGALAWYWYITHLGYRALPFLSQTEVFLFPIAAIALIYVINLVGYPFGFGWNASRIMAHIYFD